MMEAYVHGVSTRDVDDLGKALGSDTGISKSEISRMCGGLDEQREVFRTRPLDHTRFPYVYLDATYAKARVDHRIVSQAVVIATGVTQDGGREVLGVMVGDSETEAFWPTSLSSLRERGPTTARSARAPTPTTPWTRSARAQRAVSPPAPTPPWPSAGPHLRKAGGYFSHADDSIPLEDKSPS